MYLEVQQRLSLKAYHLISEKNVDRVYMSLMVSRTSFPFTEQINNIIRLLQNAGLTDKWIKDGKQNEVQKMWKMSSNLLKKNSKESEGGEFVVPTIVWCGWIASLVIFVCEIIWNEIESQIEKLKRITFFWLKSVASFMALNLTELS